jgi:hypothetical protein
MIRKSPPIRRKWGLWGAAGAAVVTLVGLLVVTSAGASLPYNPVFELTAISSSATSANANITFRTTLPAGNSILGTYGVEIPDNSWNVAGHSNQLSGKVTVVGAMTINLDPDGNCADGDTGSPQNYTFPLLDQDPGGGGPYAIWGGRMTDFGDANPNTYWDLSFTVEQLGAGFTIDGFVTSAILPPGNIVCTPQVLTLTFCGRANPTPTATVCGTGSNPIVMTNPTAAGCYAWRLVTTDESGQSSATRDANVSIGGTPCPPTPTPTASPTATPTASPGGDTDGDGVPDGSDNCPRWPNPAQNLPPWTVAANDPDCDGFSTPVETSAGTNPNLQCGFNAWPADLNNDTYSDIFDLSPMNGNFGIHVPPAPARHNVAPDPPDAFVDIFDISKVGADFALTCGPCPGDLDCDAVTNASDNCPNWSNPAQAMPPWPVPANDPDCDGFTTTVETSAGTNALAHCGANAWPADLTNDGFSDIFDITQMTGNFGVHVPPAPARQNIAPDPPDAFVDIFDISKLGAFFSLTCN